VSVAVVLPGYLRPFADGRDRIVLDAQPATVGDALNALWKSYPGIRDRVVTEQGAVRPHVNIFLGPESIRFTGGLGTAMTGSDELLILPAVSGG
jgi:molybdopterin synthase sulfur carrier subunit